VRCGAPPIPGAIVQSVQRSAGRADRAGNERAAQDAVNRDVYHAPEIDRSYKRTTLSTAETVVLLKHQPSIAGRAVLDIGVGTGRTIAFLKPLARRYACLDYSPAMVQRVRRDHPDLDVHLTDMRDLSPWRDESFDFVFAANNVLDAVGHEDRLRTIGEIRRVLMPEGLFVFSSHNRRFRLAGHGPRLEYSRNPVTQLSLALQYLRSLVNHRRLLANRRDGSDYALFADPGHDFGLIHYYVDRSRQAAQLDAHGFQLLDVVDMAGRELTGDDDDADSASLMYVARRR